MQPAAEQGGERRIRLPQKPPQGRGPVVDEDISLPQTHHLLFDLALELQSQIVARDGDAPEGVVSVEHYVAAADVDELDRERIGRRGDEPRREQPRDRVTLAHETPHGGRQCLQRGRVERIKDDDHIEIAGGRVVIPPRRRAVQDDASQTRAEGLMQALHEPLKDGIFPDILGVHLPIPFIGLPCASPALAPRATPAEASASEPAEAATTATETTPAETATVPYSAVTAAAPAAADAHA